MKEQVFVSAVLYTENDEQTITDALKNLDAVLKESFENFEIVLVNDASTDRTLDYAKEVSSCLHGTVIILTLSRTHGVEKAMMAGLTKSMGDFVYEFESTVIDFDLRRIPEMYRLAMEGSDIVVLSPKVSSSWTSKLFYKIINKITYLKMELKTETVRLVSRRVLNAMLNLKEKVRYRKALYAFTGYNKNSILYETDMSRFKKRKQLNRENVGTAFDIVVSFSNIGLKSAHYLSIFFFLFSITMVIYTLYNFIFNKYVVQGWTTLMILISLGFAGLFFIVGMLGEYISRILIELQDRPFYTTRSVDIIKPNTIKKLNLNDQSLSEVAAGKE